MAAPRKVGLKVRIRKASLSDLPILVAHRRAMWRDIHAFTPAELDQGDRTYGKWLRKHLVAGEATAFIAETASHKAVASGAIFARELDPVPGEVEYRVLHIISMFTEEPYRGQGIASKIVKELVNWARSSRYPPVVTLSPGTKEVMEFYEKAGFKRFWMMKMGLKGRAPRSRGRQNH
jgi:GNAT superfamily N-acetyltransferase